MRAARRNHAFEMRSRNEAREIREEAARRAFLLCCSLRSFAYMLKHRIVIKPAKEKPLLIMTHSRQAQPSLLRDFGSGRASKSNK